MQEQLVLHLLVKFINVKTVFFFSPGSWGVRKAPDSVVTMTGAEMNKWDIYVEIVPTLRTILKGLIKSSYKNLS